MTEYLGWMLAAFILLGIFLRRRPGGRAAAARRPAPVSAPNASAETGTVVYFATDDCGLPDKEYRFNYKKLGAFWRVYILKMPALRGRPGAGNLTHRLNDGAGGSYICWDRPITSLEDAQTVSRAWADNVQRYIATGQRFG